MQVCGNHVQFKTFCDFSKINKLKLFSNSSKDNLSSWGNQLTSLKDLRITHEGRFNIEAFRVFDNLPAETQLDMIKHFHDSEDQKKVKFDLFQILDEWWPEKCKKTLVELHANISSDFEFESEMDAY